MKKKSFSLIEVMAALAIVALLVVMLSAFLGGSFTQYNAQLKRRGEVVQAQNALEAALAYRDTSFDGVAVKISDYDEALEKVEVMYEKNGKTAFVVLRPKKSLYTP
ncbi:MAG: type II secretion system protein [Peptoniphilus sp.]|nr:type II secretion system protein [Peptoniphilus sp.]MDD7363847.1 type II secretion system protein [Bacillota bacterium]MDY6044314.1 type II secretion system protein [Peptoniphilus sp.]